MTFSGLRLNQARWVIASILLSTVVATAQTDSVRARITEAVDVESVVTLRGNTHPLARPEFDRGTAPESLPARRMMLVLSRAPEQETALRNLLDEQQIKSSPNYHRWLTPQEFGQQFGPADSDIQAVTDWLTAQDFQVNRVTAGRTIIEFSGTAGQVRQSLHTEIHKFEVNGKEYWANASDPQIPSALSPVVSSVVSLNSFPRQSMSRRLGTFSRSKITGEVRPLFTFTDNHGTNYAVGPGDFATIYNVPTAFDGTGVDIAVVADSKINIQDVRDFRNMFGLPAKDPQIILDGPDPGLTFSEGEADLDVQWSGAVAKNANIMLVASQDTETSFGDDLSALYIVDNNIAAILSDSFGSCEQALGVGGNTFYNALWQQAAAQGITVFVATGDNGSAACDDPTTATAAQFGLAVDGLASTPYDVAVGGTDFSNFPSGGTVSPFWNTPSTSPSSAKSYIPEVPWNDSCASAGLTTGCTSTSSSTNNIAGGSGGPSTCGIMSGTDPNAVCVKGYAKPIWQTGTGVPNDGVRDLPDVSLFAADGLNGSFYVFCEADANTGSNTSSCDLSSPFQDFQGAGGTSFAAPAFAGIMALVNQKTGARQGNANYVLYPLAAKAGASCSSNAAAVTNTSCIFYDTISGINSATGAVTPTGNNSVPCAGGSSPNCSSQTANQKGVLVSPPGSNTLAWTTSAGFDLATGLGSVNVTNLVNSWASVVGTFKTTTTTLVSISPTTITHGQPATVTIGVTSGTGTPTGTVSLIGNSTFQPSGIGAFTLTNGSFTGPTTFLPGGTYNVTAHYAGDGTFGASDSTPPGIQVTVSKEPSQAHLGVVTFDQNGNVTSSNATTAAYGSPYVLRANVTNAAGQMCAPSGMALVYPCPTGVATVTDNGVALDGGSFALNSQGYTEDMLIQLLVGVHPLKATYGGDSSFTSSASSVDPVTITQAATNTTLSISPTNVPTGASVTLTATVNTTSNGAAPIGMVQFLNGITPIAGNPTYVRTSYSASTGAFASVQATLTATFSTAGTDSITAQFSNDTNYANSISTPPITVTVSAAPDFTISAAPASASVAQGSSVPYTVTVGSLSGFNGSVALSVSGLPTGATASFNPTLVSGSGSSTLTIATTSTTPTGTPTLTITGSSSPLVHSTTVTLNVTPAPDFTFNANPTSFNIASPGQSGNTTLTVGPTNGFASTVNFTCAVPATMKEASCSLSPTSVTTTTTTVLTVTTTAPHTVGSLFNPDAWFMLGGGGLLGCLLLLSIPVKRRRLKLAFGLMCVVLLTVGAFACGGGSSNTGPTTDPGTAAGTYLVSVTATSGTISHTTSVSVTVQ